MLFRLSYDYVGDLVRDGRADVAGARAASQPEEPASPGLGHNNPPPHVPTLSEVVEALATTRQGRAARPASPPGSTRLDETGRWALLKLITGRAAHRRLGAARQDRGRRRSASHRGRRRRAGLARAGAALRDLFAWVEGRGERPESAEPGAVPAADAGASARGARISPSSTPADFRAEWKWDGIRAPGRRRPRRGGHARRAASTRAPARTSRAPSRTSSRRSTSTGALDGELLILREGRVAELQRAAAAAQPEGRDAEDAGRVPGPSPRLRPARARTARTCAPLPFAERRARLEAFVAALDDAAHRPLAAGAVRDLGGAGRGPRRPGRARARARTPTRSRAAC